MTAQFSHNAFGQPIRDKALATMKNAGDWISSIKLSDSLGISHTRIGYELIPLVHAGKVVSKKMPSKDAKGSSRQLVHYKIAETQQ